MSARRVISAFSIRSHPSPDSNHPCLFTALLGVPETLCTSRTDLSIFLSDLLLPHSFSTPWMVAPSFRLLRPRTMASSLNRLVLICRHPSHQQILLVLPSKSLKFSPFISPFPLQSSHSQSSSCHFPPFLPPHYLLSTQQQNASWKTSRRIQESSNSSWKMHAKRKTVYRHQNFLDS